MKLSPVTVSHTAGTPSCATVSQQGRIFNILSGRNEGWEPVNPPAVRKLRRRLAYVTVQHRQAGRREERAQRTISIIPTKHSAQSESVGTTTDPAGESKMSE